MQIAKILNGVVSAIGDAASLFPTTSFTDAGPDAEFMEENSCMKVDNNLTYDANTQKLVEAPAYIDGSVVRTVEVSDLTAEELEGRAAQAWGNVRSTRNQLLRACDWTQIGDVPLSQSQRQAWSAYRQELRDVTTQSDPNNIAWPTPPGPDADAVQSTAGNQ